jgi:hypothetical protein
MACQEYIITHVTRFPTKLDQSQNNYSVLMINQSIEMDTSSVAVLT